MKQTIIDLKEKQESLKNELEKIETAIESLQDVCNHTHKTGKTAYECEGHDSHKDYYVCTICGNENWI